MTLVFSQGGEGSLGGPAFLPRGTGLCPHRQAGHVRTRASTRVHAIPRGASSRVSRSPAEGGAGGRGRTEPLGQPEYRRRAECSTEGSREAASEQSRTGTSEEAELGFLGWPRVRRRRAGQGRGRGRGGARRGGAVGQEVPAGTQDSGGSAAAAGRPPAAVTPPPPSHRDRTAHRLREGTRGLGAGAGRVPGKGSLSTPGGPKPDLPKVARTGSLQLPRDTLRERLCAHAHAGGTGTLASVPRALPSSAGAGRAGTERLGSARSLLPA